MLLETPKGCGGRKKSQNRKRVSLEIASFYWFMAQRKILTSITPQQQHDISVIQSTPLISRIFICFYVYECLLAWLKYLVPMEFRRGHWVPWTEVTDSSESPCRCFKPRSSALHSHVSSAFEGLRRGFSSKKLATYSKRA